MRGNVQTTPGIHTATVREVGPRDGLQMAKAIMPTPAKLEWIAAMVAAGVREMEVASFVPPASMPQMADAAEVTRAARAAHPDLLVVTLAPNLRGAQNAAAAGAQSIILPVSASEAHSRSNVRRSREDQVAEVARAVEWAHTLGPDAPRIEGGIATAFGCSFQGEVPEKDVLELAVALAVSFHQVVPPVLSGEAGVAKLQHLPGGPDERSSECPAHAAQSSRTGAAGGGRGTDGEGRRGRFRRNRQNGAQVGGALPEVGGALPDRRRQRPARSLLPAPSPPQADAGSDCRDRRSPAPPALDGPPNRSRGRSVPG